MKRLCLLLAFIMLFTSGCFQKNETKSESVKLFYAVKGNAGLDVESREIKYTDAQSKYLNTLSELLKGPSDSSKFETSIDKSIKVLKVVAEKENLTIDFSKEFNVFSGSLHEAAAVASVVDTMLQFEELKKVKILVEGQELIAPSGEPYGFMEYIDFNMGDMTEREIILYFADSQAMYMVPEKRTVFVKKDIEDAEFYRIVLEELIKGPGTENLYRTIPEEVKIEYIEVEGDLLKVDFSEEMHTKHWRGAAGEAMTVNSIADTMTEFENIKKVMPTVDGGPLSIEHMVVEEPLERNESIIYRQ
ncbi:MAG TPA: GerMN domain-containing protein [Clostridia bacterium]|nr:GerMN domain-containing protein [Clostridia bacterium]